MTAKYQLIVNSDNPAEIATILAALTSSTAAIVQPLTITHANIGGGMPTTATDDDDEGNTGTDAPADPNSIDKNGLPWDDRIHSTPAALTEKGVWRAKRGVGKDKAFVAQVEAELRARGQQPVQQMQQQPVQTFDPNTQPQMQPQQQFQPQPQMQPVQQMQPQQQFQPQPQMQPVQQMQPQQQFQPQPQMQPVQQQPAPTGPMDFNMFMSKIQQLLQQRDTAGNAWIDAAYLQGISAQLGVSAITDLANNPTKINDAVNLMMQHGKWA